jgi:hypothetical protein
MGFVVSDFHLFAVLLSLHLASCRRLQSLGNHEGFSAPIVSDSFKLFSALGANLASAIFLA